MHTRQYLWEIQTTTTTNLSVLTNKSFNLTEFGIIHSQDAYELHRPLDYKIGTRSELFAVLTELGWVVNGPMTAKRRQKVCHLAFTEDVKVAENIQTWWDIETYASKINDVQSVKKSTAGTKDGTEYGEIYRRAVRSGNAVE